MLFTPPPGYSPPSINRQSNTMMGVPGVQGQGVLNRDPSSSSYVMPSSALPPSSQIPGTDPMGAQNMQGILRALQGRMK